MISKEIEALLHKSIQSPPVMVLGASFRHDMDDLVAMVLGGKKLLIVQDVNTELAFGNQVVRALKGRFDSSALTLEHGAAADMPTVEYIHSHTRGVDALVAVGSGTINDLCKYASFLDGKPYIVFPTAGSMNGYLSANASISEDGYKKTLTAHMPKAVFCDLSVIAAAPLRLNRSGLGDSLARPTAQADWLLSHLLLETPYDETPFALLAPLEEALFGNARGIMMGDRQSLEYLMQTLLLSGLGMTIAGGSYPASQSEHMIAHTMHMLKGLSLPESYHGEEIGVTTLTMARVHQQLIRNRPQLRATDFPRDTLVSYFGNHVTDEAQQAYAQKVKAINAHLRGGTLQKSWDEVAQRLEAVMMAPEKIQAILKEAGASVQPESLGWPDKAYDTALTHARFLRDRFTFLDLQDAF